MVVASPLVPATSDAFADFTSGPVQVATDNDDHFGAFSSGDANSNTSASVIASSSVCGSEATATRSESVSLSVSSDKYADFALLSGGTTTEKSSPIRLLETCIAELKTAQHMAAKIAESGTTAEIEQSQRGSAFTNGAKQIFLVGSRIVFAVQNGAVSDPDAQRVVMTFSETVVGLQQAFSGFSNVAFVAPVYTPNATGERCGCCGLSTEDPTALSESVPIEMMGKKFFVDAANLWRQKVDPILPTTS
jgi:uncharacterized protein (DUF1800 family)